MKCWLDKKALSALVTEGRRSYPKETGGNLLGYWSAEHEAVVTHIIGPGPAAVHSPVRFEPDANWQAEQIGLFYDAFDGRLTYLGDWHTHPSGPAFPSDLDVSCLKNIAADAAARAPIPLMLILGGDCDRLEIFTLKDGLKFFSIQTFDFTDFRPQICPTFVPGYTPPTWTG